MNDDEAKLAEQLRTPKGKRDEVAAAEAFIQRARQRALESTRDDER
jgi:hypothetical protein